MKNHLVWRWSSILKLDFNINRDFHFHFNNTLLIYLLQSWLIDMIILIIDRIMVSRLILEIGHCHLCIEVLEVHLKLRLQSLEGHTKQCKYYLCRISFGILWIFAKWSKSNIWNYFSLLSNAFLKSKFASSRTYTISDQT